MDETHRRECEARDWLRRGYTTPAKVETLMTLVESKRGAQAAYDLRAEMRRQWARRAEWMSA